MSDSSTTDISGSFFPSVQVGGDEIKEEFQDEDSKVIAGTEVIGLPEEIAYGIAYTVTVNPPESDQDVKLYFIDKNFNAIVKAEGMVLGIPTWNSRLGSNFPEGDYKIVVKSLGKVLVEKEYTLSRPDKDRNRKVKASQ